MKQFKLLQGQSSYASEFSAYAERIINEGHYGVYRIGQDEPPFNLSLRHRNIMPQDLRGATLQEMECFIRGWEDARNAVHVNPFHDAVRGELWNRGYWRFINRRD